MSTFSTLNTILEQKLANTSELFYDDEMKIQEINNTIRQILQDYDPPEMIKKATITFDSEGKAAKPSDYSRMIKLWNTSNSEYRYIVPDMFDYQGDTASYYWTEDYDTTSSTIKIHVKPITSVTLNIRYVKLFTEIVDSSTETGLSSQWDEAICLGTVWRLFTLANRYQEALEFERLFTKRLIEVYQYVKSPGGIKEGTRLKFKSQRISLLNSYNSNRFNS